MKIIKSLEQLLYEVMVWMVFYPLTLWKSFRHPLALMDYADDELEDADEDRYSDTLSPPIFLAITLGLIHLLEVSESWNIQSDGFLSDDKNLIAFRLVSFSLFPLMMALRMLRAKGIVLDRKTLRKPFYAQCFTAGPFAIGISAATLSLAAGAQLAVGVAIIAITLLWYIAVQTLWFRSQLAIGPIRALGNGLRGFLEALIIVIVLDTATRSL